MPASSRWIHAFLLASSVALAGADLSMPLLARGERASPGDPLDPDGDGVTFDNCYLDFNPDQSDRDGDFTGDVCDNCPDDYNPGQGDLDGDLVGDSCDAVPDERLLEMIPTVVSIPLGGRLRFQLRLDNHVRPAVTGKVSFVVWRPLSLGRIVPPDQHCFRQTPFPLAAPARSTRTWDCYIDVTDERGPPLPGIWEFAAQLDLGPGGGELWSSVRIEVDGSLVTVRAEPERLAQGGMFEIVARVRHEDGTPTPSSPVTFVTTAGALASGGAPIETDEAGTAIDHLTTYETATVTARSGSISANTTAIVGSGPTIVGSIDLSCSPLAGSAPMQVTCHVRAISTSGEPIEGQFVAVIVSDAAAVASPPFPETDADGIASFDVVNLVSDGATIAVHAGGVSSDLVVLSITP